MTDQYERIGEEARSNLYDNAVILVSHWTGVTTYHCTASHLLTTALQHETIVLVYGSTVAVDTGKQTNRCENSTEHVFLSGANKYVVKLIKQTTCVR